jgi:hypothetical protein
VDDERFHGDGCRRRRNESGQKRVSSAELFLVLSYGPLAFFAAIIPVAVGMPDAVANPDHHLGRAVAGLLYGETALYLSIFGFACWAMFRLVSTTRLGAAAVVALLLPMAA